MTPLLQLDIAPYTSWLAIAGAGALFGVGGAAHCAGMCGGFPLALAALPGGIGSRVARVTVYNFGRGFTYVFLATVAGALGLAFGRAFELGAAPGVLARVLSVVLGVAIVAVGLWLLGMPLPWWRRLSSGFIAEQVVWLTRSLTKSRAALAPFALGLVNGLLPCPLVYVMLSSAFVAAARVEHLGAALAVSAGFALGTMPIMISIGTFGAAVGAATRRRLLAFAAVVMVLMGVITIARGIPALDPLFHFGTGHEH